ncbi:signal peptide containing protein [Theileria equi strain WA]|uniref:Signal peptide containing protein n=1 Tax=Theileria equi strain WA TaxID=1537102 RepID=L1L9T2_THEEQ|nr:signal peptide containing protein [Theileria equi strain WA]EKX72187.1 signal peptide containing protein [Theileria equi strain WA]|eukprot:XP_004831639.1 signal peptide containing protein [Theileria equi strain WA]
MKFISLFYFAFIAKLCSTGCCGGENGEALDISNPDSSKVDIREETSRGIKWKVFKPKDGVTITSFTEGRVEIGKISTHGGATPEKCYEKVDGKWKETGLNDFFNKLNGIKNAVKQNEGPVSAEQGVSKNLKHQHNPE